MDVSGSWIDRLPTAATASLGICNSIAEIDTLLWMRVLDRRHGPNPPKLIAIDTRETPTTREADLHLSPTPGTNVPRLNGLLNVIIEQGAIDSDFIDRRTVGFDAFKTTMSAYPPERVEELLDVPAGKLLEAARMLGEAKTLVFHRAADRLSIDASDGRGMPSQQSELDPWHDW